MQVDSTSVAQQIGALLQSVAVTNQSRVDEYLRRIDKLTAALKLSFSCIERLQSKLDLEIKGRNDDAVAGSEMRARLELELWDIAKQIEAARRYESV